MQPYPPLGTLYAASYIRARGYEVALFDAMLAESEEEWAKALEEHKPKYAILFEDNFNYLSKMCLLRMREAAFTMIAMAKKRGCTVILCGADATDHAEEYLARGGDYVLLGEGEETLGELLDQLSVGAEPNHLIGLASPFTPRPSRRPDITDLDTLPFPAWDLVDIQKYEAIWRRRHGYYSMNMVTTRGCPYHCNWCAKPIWGQRYNSRSPENVAAEMKWVKDNFHPDHMWFADDILGLKPNWIDRRPSSPAGPPTRSWLRPCRSRTRRARSPVWTKRPGRRLGAAIRSLRSFKKIRRVHSFSPNCAQAAAWRRKRF